MRSSGPAVDPTGGLADGNSAEDVVIWKRTSAGQAELKRSPDSGLRAAAQNLLMILDGVKTEEMLLRNLVGVTREDFRSLVRLGLIEPADVIAAASSTVPATDKATSTGVPSATGLDKRFAAVLANVIKTHPGLGVWAADVSTPGYRSQRDRSDAVCVGGGRLGRRERVVMTA